MLPRNLKIKRNEDGTFKIIQIRRFKMQTSLKDLAKRTVLLPSTVKYLKEYESRLKKDKEGNITDTKTLEKIRTILSKPKLDKDPILDFDMTVEVVYSDSHCRKLGYKNYEDFKIKERIRKEEEQKKKEAEKEKKNAEAKKQ